MTGIGAPFGRSAFRSSSQAADGPDADRKFGRLPWVKRAGISLIPLVDCLKLALLLSAQFEIGSQPPDRYRKANATNNSPMRDLSVFVAYAV